MAEYTIELRDVVANHNIFDFRYPFYDPNKRMEFEQRFIRHFFFREIGCIPIDRWKIFLEDKMNVVFPYYNMLMETATIEYDIMDNYRLTETYKRNVERNEQNNAINSTVGRVFETQETETNQNRTIDTLENNDTIGKDTTKAVGTSTTDSTGNSTTENSETVNGTTSENSEVSGTATKSSTSNSNGTQEDIKKFLDTPQGKLDLNDSNYLTTLNHDNGTKTEQTTASETDETSQTTESSGSNTTTTNGNSETNTTDNSETNTTNDSETNTLLNSERNANENLVDEIKGTAKQEQHSTADNNTRVYSKGDTKEEYVIERRGNIGVDTDSDGIQKHIKLQKVLMEIEKMFFNECEDLFMLVY